MDGGIACCEEVARGEVTETAPVLTRQLLEQGFIDRIAANDAPGARVLTEPDRQVSLARVLAARPHGPVWVFGYGSLIWNSAMHTVERRIAKVDGWHRSFCLSITSLRATARNPGLTLALDRGGSCVGSAYRLAEDAVVRELELLWRREMVCGAYVPRWVDIATSEGESLGQAIAFTIDTDHPQYVGEMDHDAVVRRLATAAGGLGSSADYLLRTRDGLFAQGIQDPYLERLARSVRQVQRERRALLAKVSLPRPLLRAASL